MFELKTHVGELHMLPTATCPVTIESLYTIMFSVAGIEYNIANQLQPTLLLLLIASHPKKVLYQDNQAAQEMLCGLKSTSARWHAIQWLQSLQQSSGCNCCRQFAEGGKRGGARSWASKGGG